MRIYMMQTIPDETTSVRYYQMSLEQDLFGGWTLYREWGIQGGRVNFKREQFLQQLDAVAALEKTRKTQLKRGFRELAMQEQDKLRTS